MGSSASGESAWRRSRTVVAVGSPAAGAEWSVTVPAGHLWRIESVQAQLVTSAVVATRVARLAWGDGVAPYFTLPPAASQLTTLTRLYAWHPNAMAVAVGTGILSCLLDADLPAGWTLASSTEAIDGGDQWSAIRLRVLDTTVRRGRLDLNDTPDLFVEVVSPGPE
jgi:hypothetical protein